MSETINTTANTADWSNVGKDIDFDANEATNLEGMEQATMQEDALATETAANEAAMAAADLANSVPMPADTPEVAETEFDEVEATSLENLDQAEAQEAADIAAVESPNTQASGFMFFANRS